MCDVCRVGDTLVYTYNFGDRWQDGVVVEKAMARRTCTYPCMEQIVSKDNVLRAPLAPSGRGREVRVGDFVDPKRIRAWCFASRLQRHA